MDSIIEKFQKMNNILLRDLDFFKNRLVDTIEFRCDSSFVKIYQAKIEAVLGSHPKKYPDPYEQGYVVPLLKNLEDIIETLLPAHDPPSGIDLPKYGYLTALVNAALQPGQPQIASYLAPVQQIVNEIYGNFLFKRKKLDIQTELDQAIPPLVGFVAPFVPKISKQAPMPSTLELEQMQGIEYLDFAFARAFRAGVVLVPAGYYNVPLLWGVMGHEVGGHYMLTACRRDRLLDELRSKVYYKVLKEFSSDVATLWQYWAEEAAADVCGVLNLGPSFGVGAVSFYTAQLSLGNWQSKTGYLDGSYLPTNMQHPVQVLIPYLISGAIEGLKDLRLSRKYRYMSQLDEIARFCSDKKDVVRFPRALKLRDKDDNEINIPNTLPLKTMRDSARMVGHYISTVRLRALRDMSDELHDLQDIASWRDCEEDGALEIADQIRDKPPADQISSKGNKPTGVQLLSGGILAVIRNPDLYERANGALLRGLSND